MAAWKVLVFVASGCLVISTTLASGAAWEESLDRVQALLAAGDTGAAATVLSETLKQVLTEYTESDTTVEVRLTRNGVWHSSYFRSLEDAESLYVRALALKERISEENDRELAQIVSDLACVYVSMRDRGKTHKVGALLERALSIKEEVLEPDHVDLAITAGLLGRYKHYVRADYEAAEALYRRAISIQEKELGPEHEVLAESVSGLEHLLIDLGRYDEALPVQRRALAIYSKVYGPDSPHAGGILHHMGYAYLRLGAYAEAESLFLRNLAICEANSGPEAYPAAIILDQLGWLYKTLGRFVEAEAVLRRSLAISETVMGSDHGSVARVSNTLGNLYSDQGRYAEAERFYKRAIAVNGELAKTRDRERSNLAVNLYNLALIYRDQGNYAEAEPLLTRAVAIWEEMFGPDHFEISGGCIELALLYRALGRHAEAEPLLHRAITIADSAFGPGSADAARAFRGLGDVHLDRGQYAEAAEFLSKALAITEQDPGAASIETPRTLESLARLHRLRGEYDRALDLADRAVKMRRTGFLDNVRALSEKDAIAYSQFLRNSVDTYLTCFSDLRSPGERATGELADVVFLSKGQVSDGIFERRRSLVEEADPATNALAERLRITKVRLSQVFVEGPGDDRERYQAHIDSLSAVANRLEADLSRMSASYERHQRARDVTMAGIGSLLPEGSVLVEFMRFNYKDAVSERSKPRYIAAVVEPDGDAAVIELGEASEIDRAVEGWRDHMLRVASAGQAPSIVDQQEYESLGRELYEIVWEPVEQYTEGREIVFIAPDGALNMIAFAGLKCSDGAYLVEKHALHHLSAGRDLVRLEYGIEPAVGLFALGDPDYGASASHRVAAASEPEASVIQVGWATRNVRSGCGELSEIEVTPLPGTRREVELISARWEDTVMEPVVACFGEEASEEYFKAEAPGKRVIHLATHGYFLGGACRPEEAGVDYVGENPLLLSGLFFAGANLHGAGADSVGAEDGILTAYEVSAMDLKGTELVVLSACETGLGEVAEGEGVYGLRRAFQMAGARTVVSALWPVSDEATAEMMGDLYSRAGETLAETMRRVQVKKIEELRSRGGVDHPFTWGAFVALGDWR